MYQKRTCQTCGVIFQGGPSACYCPSCRLERQREQDRTFKRLKRKGQYRPIGCTDHCEKCGDEYRVTGGKQRFCPKCAQEHRIEYDRETSITFYNSHKERINPSRNERRRIGLITCKWCGTEFDAKKTRRVYCNPKCRRKAKNKQWMDNYYNKKGTLIVN